MQISGVSLTLTWPHRLLFTQRSPVLKPLQAFPFPSTLGEVTLHLLSLACAFIYSSCGKWVFSPSPVEFSSHHHFYKLSCSWLLGVCCCSCRPVCLFTAHMGSGSSPLSCGVFLPLPLSQAFPLLVAGRAAPLLPSLAQFVYLQFCEGFPSPPSALRAPHPLCYGSLLFLFLITQFLFFPWVRGRSVQGAMLIWPRVVCGSTVYHLAPLVCVFPSCLGASIWWWPGGPPGFSVQHEVEMLCAGWRCGGVTVLPLFSSFSCKVYLQCLSKILL
jgi:hypothetical protein